MREQEEKYPNKTFFVEDKEMPLSFYALEGIFLKTIIFGIPGTENFLALSSELKTSGALG